MGNNDFRVLVLQYWHARQKYQQHKHPENKRIMDKFESMIDKELAADLAKLNQTPPSQTSIF